MSLILIILNCLECAQCGFQREIPKRMVERPDLWVLFKERVEDSHVRHRGNRESRRGMTAYQIAQYVLGGEMAI